MRPDSIKKFDLFYLGAIAVELLVNYLARSSLSAELAAQFGRRAETSGLVEGTPTTIALVLIGILAAIQLLLWFLVSVRKVVLARYLIVLLVAINLLSLPAIFAALPALAPMARLFIIALQFIALFYLFQAESTIYLKGKRVVDADDTSDPA